MTSSFLDESNECLINETFNMALLDSGCTKTVCGQTWLNHYLDTLDPEMSKKIVTMNSLNSFKFGDNKAIKSSKLVKIPVIIANINATITTDVVEYDIPLLLSKEAMKKANTKIDFQDDKISIFGKTVNIHFSSSGHYCIKLIDTVETQPYISLLCKDVTDLSNKEKQKIACKLHRQFSHQNSTKIIALLEDSGINDRELESHIRKLDETCEICIKYKRRKPRPIVGLPMARELNETVAMDLKHWSSNPNTYD